MATVLHSAPRFASNEGVRDTLVAAGFAAHAVERAPLRRRRDPAAGVGREAVPTPLFRGNGERLCDRVFGDVDGAPDRIEVVGRRAGGDQHQVGEFDHGTDEAGGLRRRVDDDQLEPPCPGLGDVLG